MTSHYDYDLHLLGWHSFQRLCLTITRRVLGQTVEAFLDSNDAGKDGAFAGEWNPIGNETYRGHFVIQCKFTVKKAGSLTVSSLKEEFPKIKNLVKAGRCDCYVVLTNASITGLQAESIKDKIIKLGVKSVLLLGSTWICQQIHENKDLRISIPRLYGLGDLSQILDDRAYEQAKALLTSMRDDLSKIVITDAYTRASQALNNHGFVLLVGEPAAGKTTIASMLAMSALDQWGAFTMKVDTPGGIKKHWNAANPAQFFWVDDAFGTSQYESPLAHAWNHIFPEVRAMLRQGVKIVMTSRDYIYNWARDDLKQGAFPLLQESQVVIDVHDLSMEEKKQILYNHLKLGRQSKPFRADIKPFLPFVAAHRRFIPEIARRLGDPIFTKDIFLSEYHLGTYVERQESLLQEVINGLDSDSKSALALIYMRNGHLSSPIELSSTEEMAILRLGSALSGVIRALKALEGGLVQYIVLEDDPRWTFKHPTIGDAFASILLSNPEWLEIYMAGTVTDEMMDQITCGNVGIEKAVVVPKRYYPVILARLKEFTASSKYKTASLSAWGAKRQLLSFLSRRCSAEFLQAYLDDHPNMLADISSPSPDLSYSAEVDLVLRLFEFRLLPEPSRKRFIESLVSYAVDGGDLYAIENKDVQEIFNDEELATLKRRVATELIPKLSQVRVNCQDNFDQRVDDPENFMEQFVANLNVIMANYPTAQVKAIVDDEIRKVKGWINDQDVKPNRPKRVLSKSDAPGEILTERNIFDDVDE